MKIMKQMILKSKKFLGLLFIALMGTAMAFAQDGDKKVDINVNTKTDDSGGFFASPWVWVIGGAVFIIILVALLKGNSKD